MAIKDEVIEKYLKEMGVECEKKEDGVFSDRYTRGKNEISLTIKLIGDGSYLYIKAAKHLGDLITEASEEVRIKLLKWMLKENYYSRLGGWEYDPKDHDYYFIVEHLIADGDLTKIQFELMFQQVFKSIESIPEMKNILGVGEDEFYEKEKKRKELLAQLQELDGELGI